MDDRLQEARERFARMAEAGNRKFNREGQSHGRTSRRDQRGRSQARQEATEQGASRTAIGTRADVGGSQGRISEAGRRDIGNAQHAAIDAER